MPGALPLLSFTLSELYIKLTKRWIDPNSSDRALRIEDYNQLGGVAGALTRRATEEHDNLVREFGKESGGAYQATMRRVMLRMVTIEGGGVSRRRVLESELVYPDVEENKRVAQVSDRLVKARLLVKGQDKGDPYVEPAHDFLVRSWNKLQDWIREEQENLALQRLLTSAAEAWEGRGHNLGDLWTNNSRLEHFKEIRQVSSNNWLNQKENTFIKQSLRRKRTNIILRWSGISSLLAISIVVAIVLNGLRETAEQRRRDAFARSLVSQAELARTQQPHLLSRSMLLALEAYKTSPKAVEIDVSSLLHSGLNLIGKPIDNLPPKLDSIKLVSISADSEYFASLLTNNKKTLISITKIHTKNKITQIPVAYSEKIDCIALSSGSKYLAISQNNKVVIIDVNTQQKVAEIAVKRAKKLLFSADTKYLAVVNKENFIRVFELSSKRIAWSYASKIGEEILNLFFGSNSKTLKIIKGINHDSPEVFSNTPFSGIIFEALIDDINSGWQVIGTEVSLDFKNNQKTYPSQTWKITSRENVHYIKSIVKRLRQQGYSTNNVAFSSNRNFIATHSTGLRASFELGYEHSVVSVWDVKNQQEIARLLIAPSGSLELNFSSDSKYLNVGDSIWELTPIKASIHIPNMTDLESKLSSIASTSTDVILGLITNEAGNAKSKLIDVYSANTIFTTNSKYDSVNISSNGEVLAIYNSNKAIIDIIYVLNKHHLSKFNIGSSSYVPDITFSPNGKFLASTAIDGGAGVFKLKTTIWEVATGRKIRQIPERRFPRAGGLNALSPEGKLFATVYGLGTLVDIINTETGKAAEISVNINHTAEITDIIFSPDGKYLATASIDRSAKIWDLATGKEVARILRQSPIQHLVFTQDSKKLVTLTDDGVVQIQPWQASVLVAEACTRLTRNLTWQEWNEQVGNQPYEKTCPNLPVHRSVIEEGMNRASAKDIDNAVKVFNRVLEIEPNTDLNPDTEEIDKNPEVLAQQIAKQGSSNSW